MKLRTIPAALALLFALPAPAFPQATELEAVVVTATRQATRANELLSDVSIIGREEIEQAGQSTLAELLAKQPGIQIANNGGPGKATSVFIRGANASHTLLLIDGQRVGSATLGTASFEGIPLSQIERIEILRGPASALYGADAIGGVIQIFTKRGEGPARASAFAGYGTYDTSKASAGVSGATKEWSYSLQAGYENTKGFNAIADRDKQPFNFNPDRDGYWNRNISANIAFRPAPGHEIGASVFNADGRSWYDGGPTFDNRTDLTVTSYNAYSRNRIGDAWTSTLRIGRSTDDSTDYSAFSPQGAVFRTDQDQVSWQNDVKLPLGQALLGLETLKQKAHSGTNFDRSRRIDTLLAGWTGHAGPHRLQVNARHDENSQFGNKTTGLLAYGYQFGSEWRAHVSVGTGFRAPSFNELYFPGFGNANLKPEQAFNRELGVFWDAPRHSVGAVYFNNRVRDLIVFDSTTFMPQNIGRAKLEGTTFTYTGSVAKMRLAATVDLQRPRDADTGKRLIRRADRQLALRAARQFGAWEAGAELLAVGARYDNLANTRRMGGYSLLNATLNYRLATDWTLEARANNVTDKKYETVWGYAVPGANLFVGVRYVPK
ncbi:MAG: TonB-dependent receptor domain-containing protein [Pseudomonadota bacterium]|jgi:vitamin B12 transporter